MKIAATLIAGALAQEASKFARSLEDIQNEYVEVPEG